MSQSRVTAILAVAAFVAGASAFAGAGQARPAAKPRT